MTRSVMLEKEDVELIQKMNDMFIHYGVVRFSEDEKQRMIKLQEQLKMELLWWSAGK